MFCLSDFEAYAHKVLDRNAWSYYSSGVNQEQTLKDNEEAFRRCGDARLIIISVSRPLATVQVSSSASYAERCVQRGHEDTYSWRGSGVSCLRGCHKHTEDGS